MATFDENKYKSLFEQRYGKGSFDSGLSDARKIGQLKAQAEIAKKQYNDRKKASKNKSYNDALGAFGKTASNEEAEKQLDEIVKNPKKEGAYRNEEKIRNNPALQEAIKSRGWTQKEFIDAMYNAASSGQFKSERDFNSFNTKLKKDTKTANKKADEAQKEKNGLTVQENYEFEQQQKKSQKEALSKNSKKVSGLDKLKKDPYAQALNPFDDVSLKEAVTKIASKPQTKFEKESNRFADRTLDSATLGGFGSLYKGATGKQPDFLESRKGVGNNALDFASTGLGYLIPGAGVAKGLRATKAGANITKGMTTAQKAIQYGKEGAISGGLIAGLETPAREYINPEQTALDHLKRIGIETAIGGAADPALMALGKGAQAFSDRFIPLRKPPALRQDSISPRMETIEKLKPTYRANEQKPDLLKRFDDIKKVPQYENISAGKEINPIRLKEPLDPSLPRQEEQIILTQDKKPFDIKRRMSKLYQNTFDTQNLLGKISNETKVTASNSRQTQGITDFIMEKGLVDKEGRKIGESLTELTQSLPLNKENDFWRYMAHQHNVSRAAEGKNVFSQFDSTLSQAEADNILSQNPEFKEVGAKVTGWLNNFMDTWAKDLVGEDTLKLWQDMYPNYFPVYRDMDPLKQASFNGAKRGFVNQHNLVKKAKGAKSDLSSNIKDPISNIVQLVNKTVKAEKNNQVGLAILDEVKKGNMDDLFEIAGTKGMTLKEDGLEGVMDEITGQFDDVFKQVEKGNNIVKIMDNGQQVLLKVKDLDYLKALQSLSDGTGQSAAEQFEKAARKVARPIKDLITGKNPLFAVFNFMRDTPMSFIQGQEKSPIKFASRYMRALKEITEGSQGYQEFSAQGGTQSGFFKNDFLRMSNELKNPKTSPFQKFMYQVEAFNNLIESTPRYMEYLATLEKGGTKAQAIYNAAEVTTNFARHGKWGRFFDSFVLYLNPALQGLDKFVRQVKHKPLQTALKAGGVITVPQVITEFVNNENPNYEALDQRIKDDFFLIPNKFGPKDEQGNEETFFRIPKTRQYSLIFSVLVNRIGEISRGESVKEASKGLLGSFERNFSIPTRPIWSPFSDVARNKDWKNAPINQMGMELDNRSNYLKYDEKTSEIGKVLSKMLNEQPIEGIKYSPKDIDYIIDSFTGIIGDVVLPLATKTESVAGIPKKKFIADSVYSNQSVTDFYDRLQKIRNKASDKNIIENIPGKVITPEERQRNQLDKISKNMGNINQMIKETDDEKKQRELRQRLNRLAKQGNSLYDQFQK